VRVCSERGISYLVYEHFSYGKKEGDSLSHFKEVNGFQKMNLPRYYIPLTPLGGLAFKLGLHHKIVDRLPESMVSRIRDFRKTWHERKFREAAEA
jgi:hypothetical protein